MRERRREHVTVRERSTERQKHLVRQNNTVRKIHAARECNAERGPDSSGEGGREDRLTDGPDWQEVRSRKTEQTRRRVDVARNYQYFRKDAARTIYFFTNFPDNFHAKHMLNAFLKYGDFEEVVIPPKKDKRGKRFGFARAVDVVDPEYFSTKLDNIIIGSEKIMVNVPRFERQNKDIGTSRNGPTTSFAQGPDGKRNSSRATKPRLPNAVIPRNVN